MENANKLLFRVMYRQDGVIDYCFALGEDEMAARVEMLRRYPKATFVKASVAEETVTYINNVIHVDFTKKKRAG